AQRRELERLLRLVARESARQRRQEVAGQLELLLQRGQRLLHLRESSFLRGHVEPGHRPQFELPPKQGERPRADGDDLLGRGNLRTQQRFLDGGRRHARGQRQVRRLELESLALGGGPQRLHLPPNAAEHIERVAQRPLRGVEVEAQLGRTEWRGQGSRGSLTARRKVGPGGWEEEAPPREVQLPCLAQRGLCRDEGGTGIERFLHERIQRWRPKQHPPLTGYVLVGYQTLFFAPRDIGGCRPRGERRPRVAGERGRSG